MPGSYSPACLDLVLSLLEEDWNKRVSLSDLPFDLMLVTAIMEVLQDHPTLEVIRILYFESGHLFSEEDSVHSAIETVMIYLIKHGSTYKIIHIIVDLVYLLSLSAFWLSLQFYYHNPGYFNLLYFVFGLWLS